MKTNGDITIFNKVYDPATRSEVFIGTVIRGVHIYNVKISNITSQTRDKQQTGKSSCAIRIPLNADTSGKKYAPEIDFKGAADKSGLWTVQMGDVVVLEAASETELINEIDLLHNYNNVVVVGTFADNTTIGSDAVRHWRIGGV